MTVAGFRGFVGKLPNAGEPVIGTPMFITSLTSYPGLELHPSFAPDGSQVAFAWNGETQDNIDIYTKLVGSEGALRLTVNAARDFRPAWSPDGRSIAFLRMVNRDKAAVVVIQAIGGSERTIAFVDHGYWGRYDLAPCLEWAPDASGSSPRRGSRPASPPVCS
jgi:Tol biopolymer transport system component